MSDPDLPSSKRRRIAVVGPCSAGKSVLARQLIQAGYEVRQPAQEHSYVPNMWQRFSRPDVLVYLDVDYANSQRRRPHGGGPERLAEQRQRLRHARANCDFYLDTSELSPDQVSDAVLSFLRRQT